MLCYCYGSVGDQLGPSAFNKFDLIWFFAVPRPSFRNPSLSPNGILFLITLPQQRRYLLSEASWTLSHARIECTPRRCDILVETGDYFPDPDMIQVLERGSREKQNRTVAFHSFIYLYCLLFLIEDQSFIISLWRSVSYQHLHSRSNLALRLSNNIYRVAHKKVLTF